MGKCSQCFQPHTDPEKQDGDWCFECIDLELSRSRDEDNAGPVGTFLGRKTDATYRTRPPKFMLKPSEYAQYGYDDNKPSTWEHPEE